FGQNWSWDAYAQAGRNRRSNVFYPNRINPNWTRSIDAVVGPNGAIVCRSTLTNPSNGCIPTNIFGNGNAVANEYTRVESWYRVYTEQEVYAFNVQGDPFSTWAGPVSVAFGAEHRREEGSGDSDPLQQVVNANGTLGSYNTGNSQPFAGEYDVSEAYG